MGGEAKRAAAYSRELAERLRRGDRPSNGIWLFVGADAWAAGRRSLQFRSRGVLVVPPSEDPTGFNWALVADMDTLILHSGGIEATALHTLGEAVIRAGAPLAVLLGGYPDMPYVFRPRRRRVAQ